MGKFKHIFAIIVDSFGAGNDRDVKAYGDEGTDTTGCITESVDHWEISNLQKLGMANMYPLRGVAPVERPMGCYVVTDESNCGKGTMTGHRELMGTEVMKPFVTFTETGFPKELIEELEKRIGHKVTGNKSPSETAILNELAEKEIATGHTIVYTSVDSVLQICGSEETFGLGELYRCCEIARELTMEDEWRAGRVIVRPYVGKRKDEFRRTNNRHDYVSKPMGKTALDALREREFGVISVDKIRDIFDREDITKAYKSKSSVHGTEQIIDTIKDEDFEELCFVNLVDFDTLWGHRRNPQGYAKEVEVFDVKLGEAPADLREDNLSIIVVDHGSDPAHSGTDHTRERVPLLIYSKQFEESEALEEADTSAVAGTTIIEDFGMRMSEDTIGSSIPGQLS